MKTPVQVGHHAALLTAAVCLPLATPQWSTVRAQGSEPELPLPSWAEGQWQPAGEDGPGALFSELLPVPEELATANAGGGFLGSDPWLMPDGSFPTFRGGLDLFLPQTGGARALLQPSAPRAPTPTMKLVKPTAEWVKLAVAWPREDWIIDPGGELAETPAEDLRRFLDYHAANARVPVTVAILAGDERWPEDLAPSSLAGGAVAARQGALLLYPLGEPWRARLFLPQTARDSVSPEFLDRMIDAALEQALRSSEPEDQLHEYLVQLSIRLFWMEPFLPPGFGLSNGVAANAAANQIAEPPAEELTEVGTAALLPLPVAAAAAHLPPLARVATIVSLAALGGALVVALTLRGWKKWRLRRRERRHLHIWTLPEPGANSRLGGAFAGGAGGWAKWK
jgi:hypothetical protein